MSAYRMTWPVTDLHTPLALMLGAAERDLAVVLAAADLDRAGTPEWTFSWKRGRLHLTCVLPVQAVVTPRKRPVLKPAELPTLQPHGTHAAYTRHISRGTIPCQVCVDGEREYQRQRHLRRRAARMEQVAS